MNLTITTTKVFNDLEEDYKIIILRGGSRSSKSYTTLMFCLVKALSIPNITISVVRKTLPSVKKTVLRDFITILKNLNIYNDRLFNKSDLIYEFENGSIIEFFSVSDEQRIRGSKRNILFCDEGNELTFDEFTQLNIRCSDKSIIAFNPSFNPSLHWIYNNISLRKDTKEFISTYKDNPFIEQSIINEIESLKLTSPSLYNIYAKGEFGHTEGLVFDNFNIIDELPEEAKLLSLGMDFGFSSDPTSIVGLFKYNNDIIIHELLYKTGLLNKDIANELLNIYKEYGTAIVVADSAEPKSIKELSLVKGINIIASVKGPDSIKQGIDLMKSYKIYLTKKSFNLINEFNNYVWKKDKSGNVLNIPTGKDHGIDASRYCITYSLSNNKKDFGNYSFSFI